MISTHQVVQNEKITHTLFKSIRQRTEELCAPLETEDYIPQPELFVSPPKWHLAHTTWFFEEMILAKYQKGYKRFHPDFSYLFNSYYNAIGERTARANRGAMTRPTVQQVYAYRDYVNRAMASCIEQCEDTHILDLIALGLNHEQQHQELLITDLKYTLSLNPIHPVYHPEANYINDQNSEDGYLSISEGVYAVGFQGEGFCFDNELHRHKVYLHAFKISKKLVTNGEFQMFMEAGGYEDHRLWLDEGWSWVQKKKARAPLYWKQVNGAWHYYTLAGLQPVNPDAILSHINFFEANAFATWKGLRLPTEFEWEVASSDLNWGKRWEWTNSAYLPYPGFKISEGAVGEYNGKFMVNQMVLRGGSVATAQGHSRPTYRNFFHPHYQWQFAGIRLAK